MDKCIICKAHLNRIDDSGICKKCIYEVFGEKAAEHAEGRVALSCKEYA